MKHQLKLLAAVGLMAATTVTLQALPYNARGDFNGWGETPMTDDLDGTHSVTIDSLTPSTAYKFKIAENDWASSWPGGDAKFFTDTNGSVTLHFRPAVTFDGWNPQAPRVGYDDPGLFGWEVIGEMNDWNESLDVAARQMTNMGNGLYSVNYTIAKPAGTYAFKFRKSGDYGVEYNANQFDFSGGGNLQVTTTVSNETVNFQLDMPNSRWLAGAPLAAATNKVTFTVDMGVPINEFPAAAGFDTNGDVVYVRGDFNSWATETAFALTNLVPGTTIYSNTVDIVAYGGTTINYKFFGDAFPGEESTLLTCGATRTLLINDTNVVAPLAYWGDRSLSDPTNEITLQVDMAVQIATGGFNPNTDGVYLRGSFNNWGNAPESPLLLTNLAAPNTNIYAGVLSLTNWPVGSCLTYKFWNGRAGAPNGGYESISNRQLNTTSSTQTLAAVFFNDIEICDVIEETNYVTFSVNMTNAVGYTGSPIYTNGVQTVYINGSFNSWKLDSTGSDWGTSPTNIYALTNAGGDDIHSITLPMPPGQNLRVEYKYSMGGEDNEAAAGQNHVRYIRTAPGQTTYSMPLDVWTGTNANNIANLVEPELGYITVDTGTPGQLGLQWLGLKCAGLQTTTNITGPWTAHPATDGTSSTNWPTTGSEQYIRVAKPNSP